MFIDNLKELMAKNKVTRARITADLHFGKNQIKYWEQNGNVPSGAVLQKIADYFGVSINYLLGEDEGDLSKYDNITPITKRRIPLIGDIACGQPILAEQDYDTFIDAGAAEDADFALRASGDSMINARIYDGDIVFIRAQPMVNNGDIAAIVVDDSATLKRVYFYPEKKKLVLSPENAKYEPMVYIGEELREIRILGKAIAFQSVIR